MGAEQAIGIFDSGIGGLTVVKQLIRFLPNEKLVYFGDTARVPYGTKSEKLIRQYALEDAAFLLRFGIKMLVVGCNSASATALDLLQDKLTIPVTGVIEPGVSAAVKISQKKRIGVIGTTATVTSKAYDKKIYNSDGSIEVFGQPCPLLVPLVEEGWIEDEITKLTIHKYLDPMLEKDVDVIILGCTHFPVIKHQIQEVVGAKITLIDSGEETAKKVHETLENLDILNKNNKKGTLDVYVSDIPGKFSEIGTRFLGQPVVNAKRIDFEKYLIEQGVELLPNKMSVSG
jgi:glutamate racemase